MNKDKYAFAQFGRFLDNNKFRRLVDKYNGDIHVKHFSCWHQLLTLMFGQLSGRESLRDLTTVLGAHQPKCYHFGLGSRPASRNTLAVANQNRDYRIFEELAFFMMAEARRKCSADIFLLEGKAYAFDSTPSRCTCPCSAGRNSEGEREASRRTRSTTWRHTSPRSTTSPPRLCTTRRQWPSSLMSWVRIMCSTEATTHLRNFSESTDWNPSSWSGRSRT